MRLAAFITRVIDWFYIRPVASIIPLQTFRYAACGGINFLLLNTLFYFLIYNYVICYRYFDLGFWVLSPHIATMLIVFPIIFFVGFWLNKNVAFRLSPLRTQTQLLRYALSVAGSVVLSYACMKFFVEVCGIWPTPSNVLTTLVTTVYSFLAAKYFTFRSAPAE